MLIDEYFQEIEVYISNCPSVLESHVIKDKRSLHIGIIEGEISFMDGSVLFFIEFINVKEIEAERYKYSYHYQDKTGKFIFRYDMAPHHKEIKTFPHHKHLKSEKIMEAADSDLIKVLDEIEDLMI